MLKEKEVISDPVRQMALARKLHEEGGHAGINKTTSVIAEKYHWSRIKETASDVIRTCDQCKDLGKTPSVQSQGQNQDQSQSQIQNQNQNQTQSEGQTSVQLQAASSVSRHYRDVNERRTMIDSPNDLMTSHPPSLHEHHGVETGSGILDLHHSMHDAPSHSALSSHLVTSSNPYAHPSDIASLLNPPYQSPSSRDLQTSAHHHIMLHGGPHQNSTAATLASLHDNTDIYHPIDPQIISQPSHHSHHHHSHHHQHPADAFNTFHPRMPISHHHHHHHSGHQDTTSPHMSHASLSAHDLDYSPHVSHTTLPSHTLHDNSHEPDTDSFQALLNDPDTLAPPSHHHHHHQHHDHRHDIPRSGVHTPPTTDHEQDQDAVDRDMAMLIEHDDDSPSASPCPPPLRCEMDLDDTDTNNNNNINSDANNENDGLNHLNKRHDGNTLNININDSPNGDEVVDATTAFGATGTKRSDIYDVVFDAPG